ncbi:MAG: methyltransferase domain-containing protein [Alphaproteobacteria bacterium]
MLRVDIDPTVEPDIVASAVNLAPIPAASVDAVWTAHCLEHLYAHEVGQAFAEFSRILKPDGFACVIVPDLQTTANYIVADKLHEVIYQSPAGPVTAHDVVFGFGPALAGGRTAMAHRCGFTPTMLLERLNETTFGEIVIRRRPSLELAAVARKAASQDAAERDRLLAALEL